MKDKETLTKAWVNFSKLKAGEGSWTTYWTPTMGADSNSTWNRLQQEWTKLLPSSPAEVDSANLNIDQLLHLREMWVVKALINGNIMACIELAYVLGKEKTHNSYAGGAYYVWGDTGLQIRVDGLTAERGKLIVKVNGMRTVRWAYDWSGWNSDDSKRGIYVDAGRREAVSNPNNKITADLYVPGRWEDSMLAAYGVASLKVEASTTAKQHKERDDLLKEMQLERRQDQ